MIIRMMVAATNANGEPDIYFCKVTCTEDELDSGDHYDMAKRHAEDEGYDRPMVAFDEFDPAGKAMLNNFVWESATTFLIS